MDPWPRKVHITGDGEAVDGKRTPTAPHCNVSASQSQRRRSCSQRMSKDSVDEVGRPYRATLLGLPFEVLQYIFSFLSRRDLYMCRQVSVALKEFVEDVEEDEETRFSESVLTGRLSWAIDSFATPNFLKGSQTYQMSAVCTGARLLLFGGIGGNYAAFNDLWELNLKSREWTRLIGSGEFPRPKGSAATIPIRGGSKLLLYGGIGYRVPPSFVTTVAPPVANNLQVDIFSETHEYDFELKIWNEIRFRPSYNQLRRSPQLSDSSPPPALAQHGCSLQRNGNLVVFTFGLKNSGNPGAPLMYTPGYQIVCLDLVLKEWFIPRVCKANAEFPGGRFNHTQVALDDDKFLVAFGSGSRPTRHREYYSPERIEELWDAWLMVIPEDVDGPGSLWEWRRIKITFDPRIDKSISTVGRGAQVGSSILFLPAVTQEVGLEEYGEFNVERWLEVNVGRNLARQGGFEIDHVDADPFFLDHPQGFGLRLGAFRAGTNQANLLTRRRQNTPYWEENRKKYLKKLEVKMRYVQEKLGFPLRTTMDCAWRLDISRVLEEAVATVSYFSISGVAPHQTRNHTLISGDHEIFLISGIPTPWTSLFAPRRYGSTGDASGTSVDYDSEYLYCLRMKPPPVP